MSHFTEEVPRAGRGTASPAEAGLLALSSTQCRAGRHGQLLGDCLVNGQVDGDGWAGDDEAE